MSKNITRKQVAFDLNTKELESHYPTENWRNAYRDIKSFMKENGFEWQQGSVYVSLKSMEATSVILIISELIEKYPWLNRCMRDCKQTNIGKEFSMNNLFDKNADIPMREKTLETDEMER